ncbi:hypothetical protein NVP2275O_120 [Vibrio phage 2.275.O._10N.286.54.E11]|nr:hypothetical protein NVP2275O_120 [Vibrio phage 2.275.O._10N.286.54.E11]
MTINVLDYRPLCVKIASTYHTKSNAIDKDDLIQEGMVGLCNALKNFDETRGVPFAAFARWYIKDAMSKCAFKNFTHVKVAGEGGRHHAKLFANLHKYRKSGQFLTLQEAELASKELAVPIEYIWDMENILVDRTFHIDQQVQDMEGTTGHELLSDCLDESLSIAISDIKQESQLKCMIEALEPRYQAIINGRFLKEKPLPRKTIAEDLGISQQRVAQLEKNAISLLQEMTA